MDHVLEALLGLISLGLAAVCKLVWGKSNDAHDKATKVELQMGYMEADMLAANARIMVLETAINKIPERLATLEAYSKQQGTLLRRIESHMLRMQASNSGGLDEDSDN